MPYIDAIKAMPLHKINSQGAVSNFSSNHFPRNNDTIKGMAIQPEMRKNICIGCHHQTCLWSLLASCDINLKAQNSLSFTRIMRLKTEARQYYFRGKSDKKSTIFFPYFYVNLNYQIVNPSIF